MCHPPLGGACCVGVRCVVLCDVVLFVVECGPLYAGACCAAVSPPSWWGVLWWRVAPPMVVRAVSVCLDLGSWCFSRLDAPFLFVGSLLSPPAYGPRCQVLGVCRVRLPGTDRPASRARVVRHPFVLVGMDGSASGARAVSHPVVKFRGRRCPASRVPLLALCFLVSARLPAVLLFGAACCCAPPTTPANPSACCHLPPLCLFVLPRLPVAVAPPPPPGFSFCGRWRLGPQFPLSSLCLVVGLRRLAVSWRLLLTPPPAFVFCRCRRPAACLPLFFFCLCAAWAFAPPPPPRVLCFGVLLRLPSASACWRAVLACSVLVLCGLGLLLAVLCCSRCGVPCRVVPCLVVSCGWCCAALRFLVRLRPAACSALLRRSLWCCVLLLCAAPSRCVLLWVALRFLVSVGVVLLAACCAVLYGAVLCCAVVCCCVLRCAFQGGVWLRCAVPSLLWLAVSSWLRCCVLCCAS